MPIKFYSPLAMLTLFNTCLCVCVNMHMFIKFCAGLHVSASGTSQLQFVASIINNYYCLSYSYAVRGTYHRCRKRIIHVSGGANTEKGR